MREGEQNVKRPRIPYGYRLVQGIAEPEPEESRKLRLLYEYYIQEYSLRDCLKLAEVERSVGWLRSVFENEVYLGRGEYPQLISRDLWERARDEAIRRGRKSIGVKKDALRQKPVPVETAFSWEGDPGNMTMGDPAADAAWLYRQICIRGTRRRKKDQLL